MKAIKKKTYHNFMIVYNQMQRKGYGKAEAENITHTHTNINIASRLYDIDTYHAQDTGATFEDIAQEIQDHPQDVIAFLLDILADAEQLSVGQMEELEEARQAAAQNAGEIISALLDAIEAYQA